MIQSIDRLRDIADRFDAFIIDLWGVLHDGSHPYPGAVECLESLRQQNKKIILLSNAPRRAMRAKEVLDKIGFHASHYDHVLTSGEITYAHVSQFSVEMASFYYIGPTKDGEILDGLSCIRVMNPAEADFVIVTGFDHMGDPDYGDHMAMKMPEIQACLEAKLPMLCANPDRYVVKQNGKKMLCAGIIAEFYAQNGGAVEYFGKPYPLAYQRSFELLGINDPARFCAIGDSLHTDIAGANAQQIYSLLVAGGILGHDLGIKHGQFPTQAALQKVCDAQGVEPCGVMACFTW